MKTLTHKEALQSLFSPNVLGLKNFMLMRDELHVLLATLHIETLDLVHIYADEDEAHSKTQKFIDNALTRIGVKYIPNDEADFAVTYATANHVLYGDATVGQLSFTEVPYQKLGEYPRLGEVDRTPTQGAFTKDTLQIIQVNRYGNSDDDGATTHDLRELHIYIPNNRL